MEVFTTILGLALVVVAVIALTKFFAIANDVREIRQAVSAMRITSAGKDVTNADLLNAKNRAAVDSFAKSMK